MPVSVILLTLGFLFLIGLSADLVGRHTPLPRVTLLLLSGVLIGPSALDLLPVGFVDTWFSLLTNVALGIVGFLLGQKITVDIWRQPGHAVIWLSLGKLVGAGILVAATLLLLGVDVRLALILAGIAPATAPAATYDVVKEIGASGTFTDTLLGIVALDDAGGLLLFSLMLAAAGAIGGDGELWHTIYGGVLEVGGSVLLGLGLGVPMAYLTGRIQSGEPTQAEAIGLVLLCTGAALWFDLSPILAAMVMGSTVASFASHHTRPFHAIEGFEWPFMILFFLLAGASLRLDAVATVGWLGGAYIIARGVGNYVGIQVGGRLIHADIEMRRWLGLALMPQAGVALGMALLASQRFDDLADTILSVVLATTVILEIVAPFITRRILIRVGEGGNARR